MTEPVCTCPTNDHGLRVSIDPSCRRHPGHKGIGYPDCWCPQDGLIGRLGAADDCPQHGQPSAAPPMPQYATGGVVHQRGCSCPDPLRLVDSQCPMHGFEAVLSPGYQLPRSAVEQLDGAPAVMRALNELHVVPDPSGPVTTNLFAPVPDGPTDPVIEGDARRRHVAALESLQSKAVDQLTRRVLAAIEGVELRKDESTTAAMAAAAVNVFVEFLRTPPPIVTGVDGVTRIEQR